MTCGKYDKFDRFVQKRALSSPQRRAKEPALRSRQEQQRDQQILQLHEKMVDKLLRQPQLLAPLVTALEQEQQQGALRHSEYLFWSCAFAAFDDPVLFRASLLDPGARAAKYRRRTRLRGILTEAERLAVLQGDS